MKDTTTTTTPMIITHNGGNTDKSLVILATSATIVLCPLPDLASTDRFELNSIYSLAHPRYITLAGPLCP